MDNVVIHTRIYAGGAVAFGGQPAIDDLKNAGYSAVIVWSVHVATDGTLILNDTQIVSNGIYKEAEPMHLPERLAQLRKAGMQIIFSVGAGGVEDFTNIGKLLGNGPGAPGNPVHDNFQALKNAMVEGGAGIDAIDFDNEDDLTTSVMVNFGSTLADIGYSSVTFCPYSQEPETEWKDTYRELRRLHGNGFVSAIHLQCYSGGSGNSPTGWGEMITKAGGGTLLIPGLATNQAQPGPWWYKDEQRGTDQIGGSVVTTPNVAMYGQGDWSGMLRMGNYPTVKAALEDAKGGETFFFYCRGPLDIGPGKQFQTGDAVFFAGQPWWGSAPQCDAYSLSGGCSNIYNAKGACPSDLQSQYAGWKKDAEESKKHQKTDPKKAYSVDGGFIWLYDSVVNCILSGCCGGTEKDPATTAKAYREAITNGLT